MNGLDQDTALSRNRQQHFADEFDSLLTRYYKDPQLTFLLLLALHHRKLFSISRDKPNISYTVAELSESAKAIDQKTLMLCEAMADPFAQPARRYLELLQMCFQPLAGETPNPVTSNYPINIYSNARLTKKHYAFATIVACKYVIAHAGPLLTRMQQPGIPFGKDWEKEKFNHALDVITLALPLADHSMAQLKQAVKDVRASLVVEGSEKVVYFFLYKAKEKINAFRV